jgi:short-subunit dehydrogenase
MIGKKDSYALVTGASSGIGYELAKLFAKDGKNIVVVARSQNKLEELKTDLEKAHGVKVRVLVKDLSHPKSPQEILSELEKDGINVDVLVNNAGFAVYGKFQDTDWQKEAEMLQVNIVSLTELTKLFLRKMLEKRSGRILNISSVAGIVPSPCFTAYGGTKHYVLGFSNALSHDLRGSGVSVTCFCPTNTRTLFNERANSQNARAVKSRMLEMDAATAARLAYRALAKGKTTATAGLLTSLMMFSARFVPRNVATGMYGALTRPT